jgi:hypothetical protein
MMTKTLRTERPSAALRALKKERFSFLLGAALGLALCAAFRTALGLALGAAFRTALGATFRATLTTTFCAALARGRGGAALGLALASTGGYRRSGGSGSGDDGRRDGGLQTIRQLLH